MRIDLTAQLFTLVVAMVLVMGWPGPVAAQVGTSAEDLKPFEEQRTDAYAAQLEAYLAKYPKGQFTDIAALKLADLEKEKNRAGTTQKTADGAGPSPTNRTP